MSARRRILVFEYLLADAAAWAAASSSMQCEAAAMLAALVQDLQRIDEIQPVVLMATESAARLESLGCWDSRTEILTSDRSPTDWLRSPTLDPSSFDASMIIAPESGGILVSLLKTLQSGDWTRTRSLNVSWQLAETCSDKFQTYHWLNSHGIRTSETKTIDQASAELLCARSHCDLSFTNDMASSPADCCIVKPRDGVGSDRIFLVPMSADEFLRMPQSSDATDSWVLQPVVPGIACSIGFIGGGSTCSAQILPVGQQRIRQVDRRLYYDGGQIPCAAELQSAAMEVAQSLVTALGEFWGYVGADIVVCPADRGAAVAHVIEINPRLCTSYVGYRGLSEINLAEFWIQSNPRRALRWKQMPIRFDCLGNLSQADVL